MDARQVSLGMIAGPVRSQGADGAKDDPSVSNGAMCQSCNECARRAPPFA